jgi:hypothetical protein
MVAVGVAYARLKEEAGPRQMTTLLEREGVCVRIARRFGELADSAWYSEQAGPRGSEFAIALAPEILDRLPTDIHQLVWLRRLPVDRLPEYLDRMERENITTRSKVIAAVQSEIGFVRPARPARADLTAARITRCRRRIHNLLEEVEQVRSDPTISDEARESYREALRDDVTVLYERLVSDRPDDGADDADATANPGSEGGRAEAGPSRRDGAEQRSMATPQRNRRY